MHEAGKKAKGLLFVSACQGEEARVNVDGHDEIVKAKKGTRYWERSAGTQEQYDFMEKDFMAVRIITVDIRAYGPYLGGEDGKKGARREGSAFRGTMSMSGPAGDEVLNIDGECSG